MEETLTNVSVFSFHPQMYILGLDFMGEGMMMMGFKASKVKVNLGWAKINVLRNFFNSKKMDLRIIKINAEKD